ncbi:MAG: cation:proton antiporter [Nanoarchaeota archaeon]|nr:cation:proton antiporter [Nanoarchaeota archaeon]
MDVIAVFSVIAGIVFLGYFSELIFKKTNIPDVLLLMIVGILIGTVLQWVEPESFGFSSELFTTFALLFLLFVGALSIDFKTLLRSFSRSMLLTVVTFLFSVAVVAGVSYFLYRDILLSLLTGMILGGTSSAVVIPLLQTIPLKEKKHETILMLESALSDVLCIIGTVTILEIMKTGQIVASGIFKSVLSSFSLALVVGVIVGLLWIGLLYKYEILMKSYLLTIAVLIGLYAFVESPFVGGSGAIASLAFGLVLGNAKTLRLMLQGDNNSSKKDEISRDEEEKEAIHNVLLPSAKNFYSEISFFVKTFFFVYLGILIDFSEWNLFAIGFLLTLAIFLVRPFCVRLVFAGEKLDSMERTFLEILVPKGLAAAVLAGIAVQSGLLQEYVLGSFVTIILSVVFISIVLTSILVFFTGKGWFVGFLPFLHPKDEHTLTKKEIKERTS